MPSAFLRWRLTLAVLCAASFPALMPATVDAQALYGGRCAVRNPMLQGTYVGGCVGGWASGQGRAVGQDRYEGEFLDGHASGRGVYTWSDGRRFEGEFRLGRVNGAARFHYANGDLLEGDFRDNQLSGVGRMQRAGGPVQYVELRNGSLVAVTAPPAAPVYTPAPSPDATPGPSYQPPAPTPPSGIGGAVSWQPQLDFEDLFPAYLFATATRKAPTANRATRASGVGARVLSLGEDALIHRVKSADGASTRFAGSSAGAAYLGDPWGLIGVSVQSPAPDTRVTVRITVDEIAEPTEETFILPRAGAYRLYPKIRYRYERLKAYVQPAPTNVTWSLTVNGQDAGSRTQTTRVRSIQDAPWIVRTARGQEDIPWIFAGFVTEDAAWLDDLIRDAFAGRSMGPIGYQGGADAARAQVRIVYDHLKRRGVKYSSITTTSGSSEQVVSQIVRFPSDSIRTAQANCIDGSVLLASVLRKMGIEPFIVLVPGHAFMGYLAAPLQDGKDPEIDFVETTMIGSNSFDEARAEGLRKFLTASDKKQAELVVIQQARAAGIAPIPR